MIFTSTASLLLDKLTLVWNAVRGIPLVKSCLLVFLGIFLWVYPFSYGHATVLQSTGFEDGDGWGVTLQGGTTFDTSSGNSSPRTGSRSLNAVDMGTAGDTGTAQFDVVDVSASDTVLVSFWVNFSAAQTTDYEASDFMKAWVELNGGGETVPPAPPDTEEGWGYMQGEPWMESVPTGYHRFDLVIPADATSAQLNMRFSVNVSSEAIYVDDVLMEEPDLNLTTHQSTGFEDGDNWGVTLQGGTTFDTSTGNSVPRTGSRSLNAVDMGSAGDTGTARFDAVDVSSIDTVLARFRVKFSAAQTTDYEASDFMQAWVELNGGGETVPPAPPDTEDGWGYMQGEPWMESVPTGYQRFELVIPADATSAQLNMRFSVNVSSEAIYVDDVRFIKLTGNTTPSVNITSPGWGDLVSGSDVPGTYVLTDPDNDPGTVAVEVSNDSGVTWSAATVSGEINSVSSSSSGDTHTFQWDSVSDLGNVEDTQVKLRIQAYDGSETGAYDTTGAFTVDNRAPPRVNDLGSTAAVNLPDTGASMYWSYSSSDLMKFRLYRVERTSDTSSANRIDTHPVESDTHIYLDSTVVRGDSHFYYVTAVDTAGNESDSSNATTPPHVALSKVQDDTPSHRPGDTIEYTINYTNDGFGPTGKIELVDAIPDSTVLSDTAGVVSGPTATIEYSPDNGGTWQDSSYPRTDIDQIRWTINEDVDPRVSSDVGSLRFRVILE